MTPEQILNIDAYLAEHCQKAKITRILAELCETLDGTCDTDELYTQQKLQCAEAIYKQKIAMAPKNFVAGDDPYPRIKSRGMFPVGEAPSSNTLYNRTVPLRKIYKELGSEQPMCVDGQYSWLTDLAGVVAAMQSVYTVKSTRELAQLAVLQFCEALGNCTLQQQYFDEIAKLQSLPEPERNVLSKPQVTEIRRKNGKLATAALQNLAKDSITGAELTTIYDCLAILTMYGQDKRWEPLRRSDWLSIRYRGPNTDLTKENFLSTDNSVVVLTLNYGAKVQELKQAVEINISQCCPRLAKILLVLRPHVAQLQASESPLVFCMADGTAMTPGCFSQRLPGIWQRLGLTFELAAGMTGLNGARHASVNENRKRRKLTSAERAAERQQATNRLSSVHMAETVYG